MELLLITRNYYEILWDYYSKWRQVGWAILVLKLRPRWAGSLGRLASIKTAIRSEFSMSVFNKIFGNQRIASKS